MFPEESQKFGFIVRAGKNTFEINRADIAAEIEVIGTVVDVCDTARHAGSEVGSRGTEYHDTSTSHILASVVADSLDDRRESAVADREAFAGLTVEEDSAGGAAIADHVSGDHIVRRRKLAVRGRTYDDLAAGDAFADKIVGFACEFKCDSPGKERTETLSGDSAEIDLDSIIRQSLCPETADNLTGKFGSRRPVDITDFNVELCG